MKKIITLFLTLFTIITLVSCGKPTKNVSVFYYDKDDTFLNLLRDELDNKLSQEYNSSNYYASKSQVTQNLQVEECIGKTDILLMNMVDRLSSGAIVEKCQKNNLPVIFFNREPLLNDIVNYENCYYVGPNSEEQGILQVECAANLFGDPNNLNSKYDLNHDNKIQLVILKGEQGHQDAEKRTQACLSELKKRGYDIELISIGVCNWSRKEAYNLFWTQYTQTLKNVELILSNNDEMAIGAATYIKSIMTKEEEMIPVIGVDATPDGIEAVNSKLLVSTIVNDHEKQAAAISCLTDILLNEDKSINDFDYDIYNYKYIYIGSKIYTNESES